MSFKIVNLGRGLLQGELTGVREGATEEGGGGRKVRMEGKFLKIYNPVYNINFPNSRQF